MLHTQSLWNSLEIPIYFQQETHKVD